MLIVHELLVPLQKLKLLLDNVLHTVLDLVKYPVIEATAIQDAGILEINQVT